MGEVQNVSAQVAMGEVEHRVLIERLNQGTLELAAYQNRAVQAAINRLFQERRIIELEQGVAGLSREREASNQLTMTLRAEVQRHESAARVFLTERGAGAEANLERAAALGSSERARQTSERKPRGRCRQWRSR